MDKRPTSAIIDTGALRFNYSEIRKRITGAAKVMAIVKANAYGHGDIEVAKVLQGLGCEFFGVAIPEEGERLRNGGITRPIVVLGGVCPGQAKGLFDLALTPVVYDKDTAAEIDGYARAKGAVKKIHVKIDTGMGRLGVLADEAVPFFEWLKALKGLEVEAVLSHFAEAESEDRGYSKKQLEQFLKIVDSVRGLGFDPEFIDIANSSATVDYKDSHLKLIRPGIMLYGSYPAGHFMKKIELKPVMQIKTRILHIKRVPAGFPVSYGGTFTTKRESIIATLPIGYADGLPRSLSGKGAVLAGGKRAPIAGRVCMDLTMCDVTDVPGVKKGDEVVILGAQGREEIRIEEIAEKAGTISYEILCNISSRVPRVYI